MLQPLGWISLEYGKIIRFLVLLFSPLSPLLFFFDNGFTCTREGERGGWWVLSGVLWNRKLARPSLFSTLLLWML